jgi:hypothetical protein
MGHSSKLTGNLETIIPQGSSQFQHQILLHFFQWHGSFVKLGFGGGCNKSQLSMKVNIERQ